VAMSLDAKLLEILACPQDKGALYYFSTDEFLYNPRLARKYLVRDGIPVMLIDEAVAVSAEEQSLLQQRIHDEKIAPTFS
jgi:uncharacterized protein YbaR (Trm112 family)